MIIRYLFVQASDFIQLPIITLLHFSSTKNWRRFFVRRSRALNHHIRL